MFWNFITVLNQTDQGNVHRILLSAYNVDFVKITILNKWRYNTVNILEQ